MRHYLTIAIVLITYVTSAQLGRTEDNLITIQGKYFKREVEEKSIMLFYKSQIKNDFGEIIPEIILYMIDKNDGKCFLEVYSSSAAATNYYVRLLNKMGVKVSDNQWEDYKNNSKYILKTEGNIVSIEHSYINSNSSKSVSKALAECQKENEALNMQVAYLKIYQEQLIQEMGKLTTLTSKGAENIEKALHSMREKDEKISRLQDAIAKKDEIILKLIETNDKKNK